MAVRAILVVYSVAFLLSSALLFSAQPLIAKLVLPLYGGSSAVWTTCMLFFQATLLLGYGYAHVLCRWLPLRVQTIVHLVVISLPLSLPIAVSADVSADNGSPTASLLLLLTVAAGTPLFAVTTTAPLLQRWFAETSHPSAQDPYFLYAISNVGSMAALLSYPLIVEPRLGLNQQAAWWTWSYGVLVVAIAGSAAMIWMMPRRATLPDGKSKNTSLQSESRSRKKTRRARERTLQFVDTAPVVDWWERGRWVLLAFVPSSWMLAVTARATTNIAPIPLLWIIPLALYLLSFVLVFARWQVLPRALMTRLFPLFLILLAASLIVSARWQLLAIHISTFFVGAMVCHGELAKRRPATSHLTEFYWWMSVGGVLGGVFIALIAPLIFTVQLEFPISVVLACCLLPRREGPQDKKADLVALLVTALLAVALIRGLEVKISPLLVNIVVVAIPVMMLMYYIRRPALFAAALGLILVLEQFDVGANQNVIHRARSFFGAHSVVEDTARPDPETGEQLPRYRRLLHGTTQHGCQSLDKNRQCEPLQYYHFTGPLGQIFSAFQPSAGRTDQVAIIGLGTGAAACYAQDDRHITFYEVDPVVKQVAETPEYFSYLSNCGRANCSIQLGDGRLMIAASKRPYDLIVLDAFSSDAIPTHLLTREAIQLYFRKLTGDGILVFHISNRYLDLSTVLNAVATELELQCYVCRDVARSPQELEEKQRNGIEGSTYVVLARQANDTRGLSERPNWQRMKPDGNAPVWTDDYSNILSVLRWNPRDVAAGSSP